MSVFSVKPVVSFWDIGTATGRLYTQDKGIVLSEPPYVALRKDTQEVFLLGKDAYLSKEKITSHIDVTPAMERGVIASESALTLLISSWKNMLDVGERFSLQKPPAIALVPFSCDATHRRALVRAFEAAGMGNVILIPNSFCIGAFHDQDVANQGGLIMDIGAGKTEIACILGGDVSLWKSLPFGGERLDELIVRFFEEKHDALISLYDASLLKTRCHLTKGKKRETLTVRGRNTKTGDIVTISLPHDELVRIVESFLMEILDFFLLTCDQAQDSFLTILRVNGIMLAGGMSQMSGIHTWFEERLQLPVVCVARPAVAGLLGAVRVWSDWQRYSYVQLDS